MERDDRQYQLPHRARISIHALRMERDLKMTVLNKSTAISIHALRMERDGYRPRQCPVLGNFNPRAPHGARPRELLGCALFGLISIHALRMERDG